MKRRFGYLLVGFTVIALLGAGIYIWRGQQPSPKTREEAIQQAQNYKAEGNCTQILQPAVNRPTGVAYVFPTGCTPPGWEAIQNGKNGSVISDNQNPYSVGILPECNFDGTGFKNKPCYSPPGALYD